MSGTISRPKVRKNSNANLEFDPDLLLARRTGFRLHASELALRLMRTGLDAWEGDNVDFRELGLASMLVYGFAVADSLNWINGPHKKRLKAWLKPYEAEFLTDPLLNCMRLCRNKVAHEGVIPVTRVHRVNLPVEASFYFMPMHRGQPLPDTDVTRVGMLYHKYLCEMLADAHAHFPDSKQVTLPDGRTAEVYGVCEPGSISGGSRKAPLIRHVIFLDSAAPGKSKATASDWFADEQTYDPGLVLPGDSSLEHVTSVIVSWLRENGHLD